MAQLEAAGSQHLHPADPQAAMMKNSNGRIEFVYNAQVVVDADAQQLTPVLGSGHGLANVRAQ